MSRKYYYVHNCYWLFQNCTRKLTGRFEGFLEMVYYQLCIFHSLRMRYLTLVFKFRMSLRVMSLPNLFSIISFTCLLFEQRFKVSKTVHSRSPLDSPLLSPMTSPSLSPTASWYDVAQFFCQVLYRYISLWFGINVDYLCFLPQL